MLNFKKDEVKTLAELQEKAPEMYSALMAEAKRGSDEVIQSLQSKLAKIENGAKIQKYAAKLGLEDLGQTLVNEDVPYNEACEKLLDSYETETEDETEDEINNFLQSSAVPAGASTVDETDESPKTLIEAINLIAQRDGISKNAAKDVAKSEFPNLFTK
jgi:hypothetical protein